MNEHARPRSAPAVAVAASLAAALLVPLQGVAAQDGLDARWLPWLGCWTEVGAAGETLCVRPTAGEGVELVTVREDEITGTRVLRADGVAREVTREGCTGTERAEFSSDGQRVYLRSDFTCEGALDRKGTGLIAMVTDSEWIRVESVDVAGERAAVTERYRRATGAAPDVTGLEDVVAERQMAVTSARQAAAASPSVQDLVEASRQVDAEALRAWVAELDEPLDVDAEKLTRLADEGVPPEVIDVVVAVSFPEEFAVERDARGGDDRPAYRGRVGGPFRGRGYFYPDPFYYGYAPFGYGYRGYGWWYGAHRPTVVIVRSRGDDGSGGRVVNGQGYTRGNRPTQPAAAVPGAVRPARGSVSPAGMSSGRSGTTGRKAKPRGSGDDGSPDGGA